ncbi:hypothetical protein M413DRAFT_21819 [Hebeloma cylindrosporum]|uniref:HMG box domain-containing protein n=1 Tax=Hebeloma cylindrosporum TaxID=76867 RepID=A0A0C3CLT5_HEBCY|nr:hypothetical protein M413DRAFT_21819 [Hebeloma cylindrosporum h7]
MALLSRVFGWSPPENEEFVDIDVSSSRMLALQNPTFHISDTNSGGRPRRMASGNFESTSPASSTSALSTDGESPADKRPEESGRHADPAWVARPRNEFILFRCDYVRKHSREGKRIRRPPGAEAEKTLSKQAAEAWHHLPPEERLYWKERANGERNEHARRYPDYRYRPKKSATGRRRQTRSSPTKVAVPASQEKRTKTVILRPEATSPSTSLRPSVEGTSTNGKATPRRYSSVPDFNGTDPMHRRLRSTASQGWLSADRLSFGPPSRDFTPVPSGLQNVASFSPSALVAQEYSSPNRQSSSGMLQSSSSLYNWNIPSTAQPTQSVTPTSVSLHPLTGINDSNSQSLSEYTTGGTPNPIPSNSSQQFAYLTENEIQWMSELHQYENDANATQIVATPAEGDSAAIKCIYGSGGSMQPSMMVDYGLNGSDSIPIDLMRIGVEGNPETLFPMDADEFFNSPF